MVTCMTCLNTARRWGTWEEDPRMALHREIEWEGYGRRGMRNDRGQRLKDELLAVAALIAAHREEFEQRREWLKRKAAMEKKPAQSRPRSL
jgi:hypothetical protein